MLFGGLGYVARKNGFPFAPCVLAMILGESVLVGLAGVADETLDRILPIVVESGHSRFPVVGEDRDEVILDGEYHRPNGIHVVEADGVAELGH